MIKSTAIVKRLYTLGEAATYLGRSTWSVRRLIWNGDLPSVRAGGRVHVDLKEAATRLGDYINRKKVTVLGTPDVSPTKGDDQNKVEVFERIEENMELAAGIEPVTCGLQNRCSTN